MPKTARLQKSFSAIYCLLERPQVARRVAVSLLVIHTLLLGYSAYVHSPTLNEPAHLVAGLSYWKFGRFDIYNVNPPLVRMVAALPVIAVGYNEDWSGFYAGPGARPEMGMGEALVKANGERSFFLFMIARWACIPFSWLGAAVCFLWARDLYGRPAGVMAGAIWCFEPNILAHAALITPDAHATALGLAACYTFWLWLQKPSWSQAALTGVILGLAELAKTTLIVFYPLWPAMWVVYRWRDRKRTPWLREAGMLALRMVIGLYVLNLGYAFEGSLTPLEDFHFVSDLFTGGGSSVESRGANSGQISPQSDAPSSASVNRFARSWLGWLSMPFPKNYLLGIDIQEKDFEHYGRPSYLRGVWREHGWWYYYLYACAIKVPIGLWALGFLSLVLLQWARCGEEKVTSNYQRFTPSLRDQFVLLLPAVVIFTTVSAQTGFSEHMRYVLPAFPPFFVNIGQIARVVFAGSNRSEKYLTTVVANGYNLGRIADSTVSILRGLVYRMVLPIVTFGCLLWFVTSSMWSYPHSLGYFNESIGGPLNGPKHLLGSNADWGQGLIQLNQALESHSQWGPIAIAYHGPANPEAFGSRAIAIDWTRRPCLLTGYSHVAISSNILAGDAKAMSGFSGPDTDIQSFTAFFRNQEPVDRLDGSLLVFATEPYVRWHQVVVSALANQSSDVTEKYHQVPIRGLPSPADVTRTEEMATVSGLLHLLILRGLGDSGVTSPRSGVEALRILTNERRGKAIFGASPFVRTTNGVRYRLARSSIDGSQALGASESHRDQCLATFAALNLPLDHPVVLESETLQIRDLLSESIANFTYDQSEMAWTEVAYVHYLSPARNWKNRFARTTTFSELLRHIMNKGFAGQSCGGLHVLQAVIATVEADYRYGILDPKTRIDAHQFVKDAVAEAIKSQNSDGSWDFGWHTSIAAAPYSQVPSLQARLVITGHMLEIMQGMREQIPPQVYVRSAEWLLNTLASPHLDKNVLALCPLTHALRSVQLSYANRTSSLELEELFANHR